VARARQGSISLLFFEISATSTSPGARNATPPSRPSTSFRCSPARSPKRGVGNAAAVRRYPCQCVSVPEGRDLSGQGPLGPWTVFVHNTKVTAAARTAAAFPPSVLAISPASSGMMSMGGQGGVAFLEQQVDVRSRRRF